MASSGTYLFNPDLADIVDEAFERVGVDPAAVTARHIKSARRSMNLMLQHWATQGVHSWAVEKTSVTTTPGMTMFLMPPEALDILTASLSRDGVDVEMYPITRNEYQSIPDKSQTGRPDRYFVDRVVGANTVYIWTAVSNSTDVIEYWYFRQLQDAGRATNTLDIPAYFYEAFCAGLAAKLAEKYSPARLPEKAALARETLRAALLEGGSRAPLEARVSYRR